MQPGPLRAKALGAVVVLTAASALLASSASANHIAGATYNGTHAGGGTFGFTVTPDGTGISRIAGTNLPGNGGGCAFSTFSTTYFTPLPIVNHSFSDTDPPNTYSGSFPTIGTASGVLQVDNGTCDSGTVAWSATTAVPPPKAKKKKCKKKKGKAGAAKKKKCKKKKKKK